jgi:putative sigma-54 modulation protein
MKTEITTRHFELDRILKERTEDRLNKLHKFFERISDARVVVSLEKNRYNAEASLTANGAHLSSHAVAESDKVALEQVLDKLEAQVRRRKDRMKSLHRRRTSTAQALTGSTERAAEDTESKDAGSGSASSVGFDESDLDGLVGEDAGDVTVSMSVAEAAAQLRASRREVLGFTDDRTSRRTLVFKRRDGNVGVVDIHD